jgi:hypothetical protein
LGRPGLFAAGAYAVALLTDAHRDQPLAGAAAGGGGDRRLCGVLIALPSLRVKGPYLAMVTLAFGVVVEKLVSEWTDVFGGAQGIYGIRPLTWNGQPFTCTQWVWFGDRAVGRTHLLLRNLLGGRFGRALLSLQADEIASRHSVGVRVYRAKVLAFVIAAVTCGIAGALVAQQNQYINSDFITFHLSIFILLLVLFGGVGLALRPAGGRGAADADRRAAGALARGAALRLRRAAAVRAVRDARRRDGRARQMPLAPAAAARACRPMPPRRPPSHGGESGGRASCWWSRPSASPTAACGRRRTCPSACSAATSTR